MKQSLKLRFIVLGLLLPPVLFANTNQAFGSAQQCSMTSGDLIFFDGFEIDNSEADCAAEPGAMCFYVAVDGNDSDSGSINAPFKTFHAAIEQAGPGDFIYARGGTYNLDNAVLASMQRLPTQYFSPPCQNGLVEADGYCQVPRYAFASLRDWNGYPMPNQGNFAYSVADGELNNPITLRNFPGEIPVLDTHSLYDRGTLIEEAINSTQSQRPAIQINKSHWHIIGLEIVGGSVNAGGNGAQYITIEACNIHDLTINGGENPGLIQVVHGPKNIRIINNRLHNLFDLDMPGEWQNVPDVQHFGAVTMMSGETYGFSPNTETGALEICGNTIYNVPQVFFFKNPATGPIDIDSNHIYDSGRLGSIAASNVSLIGNLIHGVKTGVWRLGLGHAEIGWLTPEQLAIVMSRDGHNLIMQNNTLVGLQDTMANSLHGENHVFENNLIMGLPGSAATAGWNSASYIKVGEDTTPQNSRLQTFSSNDNCFIVEDPGFQMVARYNGPNPVEHYDLSQAQSTFLFDVDSTVVIESDPNQVFVNPAGFDYTLLPSIDCSGPVGYGVTQD